MITHQCTILPSVDFKPAVVALVIHFAVMYLCLFLF
jgi:hypothetical protein